MPLTNRTLIVLKYLWENTDEDRTAPLSDIAVHLAERGITADPRTLRKDIDQLIELGVDIVKDRRIQNHYHVASRHFDAPEVKLLIDAVQSARFITGDKSRKLIDKLSTFAAPSQHDILHRELYVDHRAKAVNEAIYRTVDSIQTAIALGRKLRFQYFDYAPDKTLVLRHGGSPYSVSPFALLWNNDAYYMVGYHDRKDLTAKFRVDRITSLVLTDEKAMPRPENLDLSAFFSQEFSMLGGSPCTVELLCENALMGSIVDRFGASAKTEIVDDGHFKVWAEVELSGTFYGWVLSSMGCMRLLSPPEAVREFYAVLDKYRK